MQLMFLKLKQVVRAIALTKPNIAEALKTDLRQQVSLASTRKWLKLRDLRAANFTFSLERP